MMILFAIMNKRDDVKALTFLSFNDDDLWCTNEFLGMFIQKEIH